MYKSCFKSCNVLHSVSFGVLVGEFGILSTGQPGIQVMTSFKKTPVPINSGISILSLYIQTFCSAVLGNDQYNSVAKNRAKAITEF